MIVYQRIASWARWFCLCVPQTHDRIIVLGKTLAEWQMRDSRRPYNPKKQAHIKFSVSHCHL